MPRTLTVALGVFACAAALVLPALASAHLERPSYWPDPGVDQAGGQPTGGDVPQARSLRSAVTGRGPGDVRVVCKGNSDTITNRAINQSQDNGYRLRPSQPKIHISDRRAQGLRAINRALFNRCRFNSVQKAVTKSQNNDRVVIMPGRYTEPKSRAAATNDSACTPSMLQEDASGSLTPSYEYQVKCPNDQNLIHVAGRALAGEPVAPPLDDRHGIPSQELGPCVRCNLQIEGSGPRPTDVLLDGGKGYTSKAVDAEPGGPATDCGATPDDCYAKHVVMRVDRADGFVGRNFLTRGAKEHGFYAEEVDGALLDKVDFFWAADYGHLSFTSDHAVVKNCDSYGAGDAAVYPGAAPETGTQRDTSFYPEERINTVIKQCDLRGSDLGFSGSMGNAVRITENHIYGNVSGIVSDTLSSGGHPGFPLNSSQIDHNLIYSNNLDLFQPDPPVHAVTPAPMGVGIVYAGANDSRVHDNYIFDNWRNGAMLFAVPDALTSAGGAEGEVDPGISCPGQPPEGGPPPNGISTSCGNQHFDNFMGQAPPGFKFPATIDQYGGDNEHGTAGAPLPNGNLPLPNGNDFWWDDFTGNTSNCWFDNTGPDGTAGSVTGPGVSKPPDLVPRPLPSDCTTSVGIGDANREAYLLECSNGPDEDTGPLDCDWWQRPAEPLSAAAAAEQRRRARAAAEYAQSPEGEAMQARIDQLGD